MTAWIRGAPPSTLLYLMKQVELAVRAELDDLTRPAGLTALQYTALTVLERHPDLTAAHLARHSFVTGQSMADMVTALLDRGLIERHRDPGDRRRLVIALTPRRAQRCSTRCARRSRRWRTRMLSPLSARAGAASCGSSLELCRDWRTARASTAHGELIIRKPVHQVSCCGCASQP